jgi:hypothetical protein
MPDSENDQLICPRCSHEVVDEDDFCPQCGELFADEVRCSHHPKEEAAGVCIICALPFCDDCGGLVAGHFLCEHHETYEIYEGMVRVYGVLDDVTAQFARSCLEQSGLHPMLFCRRQPKGGARIVTTLFSSGGDYDGHAVNEIKVMVPCSEVEEAERLLTSLNLRHIPSATA